MRSSVSPVRVSFFAVDVLGILQHRVRAHPAPVLQFAEKTALAPGVAGDAARPAPPAAGPRRRRSPGASRAPSARGPDSSPLRQSLRASATSRPPRPLRPSASSASRFIQATISTRPLAASCATPATRPSLVPSHLRRASPSQPHLDAARAHVLLGLRARCTRRSGRCSPRAPRRRRPRGRPRRDARSVPTPPLAITGTLTASATARVSARSKPSRVPSRSMLVSRISPAPAAVIRRAQSTASRPVGLRPPCV